MTNTDAQTTILAPPPTWEIEWRIVEIATEQLGLSRADVSPQSRLIEDLNADSLDLIDLVMEVEEAFSVSLPDVACQQFFASRLPVRLTHIAELVVLRWGTGLTEAPWFARRIRRRNNPPRADSVPFTQLGGRLHRRDWLDGQLYEPIGTTAETHRLFRRRTDGMRCVHVPGDEVTIGRDADDALPDQRPQHRVEISPFLIDAEPVSNMAFARFLNSIGPVDPGVLSDWFGVAPSDHRIAYEQVTRTFGRWRPVRGAAEQPVMLVSWFGANAYALWANRRDWRAYLGDGAVAPPLAGHKLSAAPPPEPFLRTCLPSEAQWEYAARGREPRRFPWGDAPGTADISPQASRGGDLSAPRGERSDADAGQPNASRVAVHDRANRYTAQTIPAASVSARLGMSPFGLHHMAGNVWQWCRDWYCPDFYRMPEAREPDAQNARPTSLRSERGGSWVGPARLAESSYRRARVPHARGRCLGFRCIGMTEDLP